jgi:hypothetical protein
MKKQILIEKYIEPSEKVTEFNGIIVERWFDKYEYKHSFMGQPAVIVYNENKKIIEQRWYKKGFCHRDGDLPACIFYFKEQTSYQEWYKNGKRIK